MTATRDTAPQTTDAAPRRLTIKDVAQAAGVSLTTVSHALNDRGYVDPETRAKVKRIAAELGYRPNLRAQRLRTGKTNSIAVFFSMPLAIAGGPARMGFMMEIVAAAAEAAMRRGLSLVLVPPLVGANNFLDELDIDGAIVIEPVLGDVQIGRLRQRGVSVVSIGRPPEPEPAIPYVDLQTTTMAQEWLEHLYGQGARRIALLIGAQPRHSNIETERVYRAFVEAKGMPLLIRSADVHIGEDAGAAACRELLAQDPAIDAVCVPVDAFATGTMQALQAAGRRVPQDVQVVTRYDGLRARNSVPPITAVNLHLEQLAVMAVELLFEHICGDTRHAVLAGPTPTLIVRASSTPEVAAPGGVS
ncbi:MAG: LacI family DNA-binding transcriptional regulator [Pseudomonadota bacterium]